MQILAMQGNWVFCTKLQDILSKLPSLQLYFLTKKSPLVRTRENWQKSLLQTKHSRWFISLLRGGRIFLRLKTRKYNF